MAIASPAIGTNLRKLVKKEVAKQISKAQGPAGPTGATGATGAPGADGTAKAGARVVGTDATFSAGTAFGGIEATKSAAGGYCIRVPFTPRNIQVTVTDTTLHARARLVAFGGGFGTCASSLPGYQAWVSTHANGTDTFTDEDFFILVN